MPTLFETYVAPARERATLWRMLAGLLGITVLYTAGAAAMMAVFALASGRAGPATGMPALSLHGDRPGDVLFLLSTYAALGLAVVAVTRLWHRRHPGTLLGIGFLPEALRAALTLSLILGGLCLVMPSQLTEARPNLPLSDWLWFLLPALVLTGVQTLSEELVFRGYLMQQLGARFRSPLIWLVIPALLFGAAHFSPRMLGGAWPVVVVMITAFALVMGDLTRRHGNCGAAWGLHLVNNLFILLILSPEGPLSGLALYIRPETVQELALSPVVLLVQVLPYLLVWAILRRPLPR